MKLTNMLLMQLSGNQSRSDLLNCDNSKNFNFDNYLSKAEKRVFNDSKNSNKTNSVNKNSNKEDNYNNNIQDNNRYTREEKNANGIDKKGKVSSREQKETNYSKKIENDSKTKEDKSIVIVDENAINQLSQLLGLSKEKIIEVLSELSMSISMFSEIENIIPFIQQAMSIENSADLLLKDGIKDMIEAMNKIGESIGYKDFIMPGENIEETISLLKANGNLDENIKLISLDESQSLEKINELLKELNGKVVSSNESNSNSENTEIQGLEVIDTLKDENSTYYGNSENKGNFQNFLDDNKQKQDFNKVESGHINIDEVGFSTKVFNASLPKTQSLKNINSTDIIKQIMERMKFSVKPDVNEVKILLRPEHLGEVSLKIATQNGIITAQFTAENQKVKEIIESNFSNLKDILHEQGIEVGSLEVNISDDSKNYQFKEFSNEQGKSQKKVQNIINDILESEKEEQTKVKEEEVLNSQVNYSV